MINKNIYLVYPAGYHGNYLKWAIESSDTKNTSVTQNPINTVHSRQYGGTGTSHHHPRIPSHQNLHIHNIWMMHNRPSDHRVYLINSQGGRNDVSDLVSTLLLQDSNGIVINLHDDDDENFAAYGRINCVTKWPTFILATPESFKLHPEFDAFNCSKDKKFRNYLVKNNRLGSCGKPNIKNIEKNLDHYQYWFSIRNTYQPHEVNHETYPPKPSLDKRFFDFSLKKILSSDFPSDLHNLLTQINVFDDIDVSPLQRVHDEYVRIQPNLKWFDSISAWEKTGILDEYLLSHSVIEAEIVSRIFKKSGIIFPSESTIAVWLYRYNFIIKDDDWPLLYHHHDFFTLPDYIKKELTEIHGFFPLTDVAPNEKIKSLSWEDLDTEAINDIYQTSTG